jgi:hypothetical protein
LGGRLFLHEVNFANANLDNVDFTGAIYDERTVFPEGYIPEEHGLTSEAAAESYFHELEEWQKKGTGYFKRGRNG